MNVVNVLLILIVLAIGGILVYYMIKKNKNAEEEEKVVDEKSYTLDAMMDFIKQRLDEITKVNLYDIGLSEEELKRRKAKKYELRKALKGLSLIHI